ncbi:MAG: threonine--tRNA ligase [Patescibacteria group bacterium]
MPKQKSSQNIEKVRHSLAHLLAMAVLEKYPKAEIGIGPTIENGFYYDFGEISISDTDLPAIQKRMIELIKQNLVFKKENASLAEAKKLFRNQPYKLELITELHKAKKSITIYKTFSIVKSQKSLVSSQFIDLCAGPHIKSTSEINPDAFKLTKIAGAYWRGSEKNPMLTRIYGLAFESKKELDDYLKMMEEAEKRDHRKIGKDLELFMFSEDIGPGLPFWLPKGMVIREELEKLAKEEETKSDYVRVWTPHIAKSKIYETSGHIPYYQDSMYPAIKAEDGDYYLKPMNCPFHYIIFKNKSHSYREMPIRIAEYGTVYRYEKSGELLGLFRPRGFTQNDAHIICSAEQIKKEFLGVMEMHSRYYKMFGIKDFYMRLSLRDPKNKEKFIDNEKMWRYSERVLKEAMEESCLPYEIGIGEAAFYGPKIDFQVKSVIGKEYSVSTSQLDFSAGPRFELTFINNKSKEETAFVIHRSPLGSHERFIAFLIEHFAGAFPLWLAPVQAVVIPISDKQKEYSASIAEKLKANNIRAALSDANETLGKRIREAELQKIPYILIIGEKEIQNQTINIRYRNKEGLSAEAKTKVEEIKIEKLIEKIKEEIEKKII